MEKKNKIIIGVVIAVIVIAIIAVVAVVLTMNANTPKGTVEGMFKALINGDATKVAEYVDDYSGLVSVDALKDNSQDGMTDKEKALYSSIQYKINQINENGNNATVEVEVTNKNFKTIVTNYMQKIVKVALSGEKPSDEEIDNYLLQELQNTAAEMSTNTQTINLEKADGKWKVKVDNNLKNLVLPGLQDVLSLLNSQFNLD